MITRRHLLAATGSLAAVAAAGPVAAQAPNVMAQVKNGTMQMTRAGSQRSRKGPADYFTARFASPLFQAPDRHARRGDTSRSSRVLAAPGIRIRWARS